MEVRVNTSIQPSSESIRTELREILASNLFMRSERLSRFLRFVVEDSLQAYQMHSGGMINLKRDYHFDSLRTDARFKTCSGALVFPLTISRAS